MAFIPVEVNEPQDQTDTTGQTQDGDEDIAIVHPPNLAPPCNYVKSWLGWNYQLSLTYPPIIAGIRAGKLEYREGSLYGNPYLRVLRRQLEKYIAEQEGPQQLAAKKHAAELHKINTEINSLKRKLAALQKRKAELEVTGKPQKPSK